MKVNRETRSAIDHKGNSAHGRVYGTEYSTHAGETKYRACKETDLVMLLSSLESNPHHPFRLDGVDIKLTSGSCSCSGNSGLALPHTVAVVVVAVVVVAVVVVAVGVVAVVVVAVVIVAVVIVAVYMLAAARNPADYSLIDHSPAARNPVDHSLVDHSPVEHILAAGHNPAGHILPAGHNVVGHIPVGHILPVGHIPVGYILPVVRIRIVHILPVHIHIHSLHTFRHRSHRHSLLHYNHCNILDTSFL